jgi:signal transduction histidine kinase
MFVKAIRPRLSTLSKLIIGLSASMVLLLLSIGYSFRVSGSLYESKAYIERHDSLVNQLVLLNHKLAYCESNLKGYILSGEKDFHYRYDDSKKIINQYKTYLGALAAEYPLQKESITQIQAMLSERILLMDNAINIYEGRVPDKIGLKKRYARAQHLNNRIETTAQDLIMLIQNELGAHRKAQQALFEENEVAICITIVLGILLALMISLMVKKDLAEREKAEEQLRLLNNQKSQFFSIISHDLRGPTRNTVMLLEMLKNPVYTTDTEESDKMADMALESARQTQKLVEDLLAWGRLQMNELTLRTGPLRPFDLSEKVCKALAPAALMKDISLENAIPADLWIQADSNMVETVIRNLISNAIKFTPRSGRVQLRAHKSGSFVEVCVQDSGVGMPQDAIKKIFAFHAKHSTKGTAGETGSGFGLAVCREFVERNGGSIDVESKVGQGSKFNVRLPLAQLAPVEA